MVATTSIIAFDFIAHTLNFTRITILIFTSLNREKSVISIKIYFKAVAKLTDFLNNFQAWIF